MKECLILDIEKLEEENLSIDELLYIYKLYKFNEITFENTNFLNGLQDKGFIKINRESNNEIRQKGKDLIDSLIISIASSNEKKTRLVKSSRVINKELENNVEIFRNKFRGLKRGVMGSPKACRDKLYRWMKENPEYNIDQILKAVDVYIDSLKGDYRFLQQADYFIFKQNNNKEESSKLSAFIEEIDDYVEDGWTNELK